VATQTAARRITELTFRGLVLGVLITLVFTAANVYLGLKVGLTFATSIPAAVISMAVLSAFKNSSILENNIVQTVASAAGTLSSVIFVLPGLVIVGWWTGFPFWTSFWISASGGVLGVMFTIPLRRAMVTTSDLPYPEGVAAAEVLEVGDQAREAAKGESGAREGLLAVLYGSVASALLALFGATRVMAAEVSGYFRVGSTASGYDMAFSLALVGAGYLVGLSVGMAMLAGLLISWAAAVPILVSMTPQNGVAFDTFVDHIWRNDVRFIGAGAIAVAAIWTLTKLAGPVVKGVISTMRASRAVSTGDTRDVDMSPVWIGLLTIVCLAVSAWLLQVFLASTPLAPLTSNLLATALPFIFLGGFLVSAICGYMAGLIGASNSPLSGVGILAIICLAVILIAVTNPGDASKSALVAYALFVTAIVFGTAAISNNNLQDLKTGQLVGATPRAQQWALIVGVLAGAAVIPPVLNLLNQAYGFTADRATALPAPQANLISALAQGVIEHKPIWQMLAIGGVLGVGLVVVDEFLGRMKWLRLPPLAIGIGIYLPMSATLPVVLGAVIGHFYDVWSDRSKAPEHGKRLGVLVASGLIVGEGLFQVVLAGLIVMAQGGLIPASDKSAPLGLVGSDFAAAPYLGWGAFAAAIAVLYVWIIRRAKNAPAEIKP
jgi:putative OPT family oligopeptide transporter